MGAHNEFGKEGEELAAAYLVKKGIPYIISQLPLYESRN